MRCGRGGERAPTWTRASRTCWWWRTSRGERAACRSTWRAICSRIGATACARSRLRCANRSPPHDPVCGSGTLAIEAALFAAARAPGEGRTLACETWPRTAAEDATALRRIRAELRERAARRAAEGLPPLLASDRDVDAVAAARENARAAGVELRIFQADAREIEPLSPPGQLLLNVPYGERLEAGGRKQLKTFYHQLGAALGRLSGHRAAVLSASEDFESAFGIRPHARHELWNGPLRTTLRLYQL